MRVRGIDLAMFQGDPDFIAMSRDESLVFAVAKATEGQGYYDPKWERNLRLAPSSFEFFGCYHVLRGTSDGALQAEHAGRQWERVVIECKAARSIPMPVMMDFEIADKRAPEWLVDNAVKFRTRIEQLTGLRPLIYSYPSFLREQCGDLAPDALVECPQWPALYVGKKWADMAAGFDPYEWLRARKLPTAKTGTMLPLMWSHAPWVLHQYDGDKGEYYRGVDFDFNAAVSREALMDICGVSYAKTDPLPPPLDSSEPTWPGGRNPSERPTESMSVDMFIPTLADD